MILQKTSLKVLMSSATLMMEDGEVARVNMLCVCVSFHIECACIYVLTSGIKLKLGWRLLRR